MNCGEKICRQFVVSGRDGAKVLNLVEEALDEIALPVKREIAVPLGFAVGFWRDDRRNFPLREALEHFSIRLGVSRVREISVTFFFGNTFEKSGDCSPKLLNCARLHLA